MIKGDKIKLVKPMGVFTNVGEICEVIDIAEGGVISFRFGGRHLGCMSYDEYLKYFEKVEESKHKKHKSWSEWKETRISFYDLNNRLILRPVRYRDNGKKVQVRSGCIKAESSCYKTDIFDFDKGFDLAVKRLIVKYLGNQVNSIASKM